MKIFQLYRYNVYLKNGESRVTIDKGLKQHQHSYCRGGERPTMRKKYVNTAYKYSGHTKVWGYTALTHKQEYNEALSFLESMQARTARTEDEKNDWGWGEWSSKRRSTLQSFKYYRHYQLPADKNNRIARCS